jgi:hypothetical protein
MADTKKGNVIFCIGDDDEEEVSVNISNNQYIDKQNKTAHSSNNENIGKENVKSAALMEQKETTRKKRRQSDVCISSTMCISANYNPTRGATCGIDRYRHNSDTDPTSRLIVLHPTSKVPIEVRRNHSGYTHFLKGKVLDLQLIVSIIFLFGKRYA